MAPNSPALFEPALMASRLQTALPGFRQVEWVERTRSTNADLLERARGARQMARPWLLGAHLQESGRGRAGRTWQNRAGANLMFSCAFDVFLPARSLPVLSPLAGVAACEALRGLVGEQARSQLAMKWPNDVHWKFAKLAGILVEATRAGTTRLSADHHVVIMGMGLNLEDARALSQSLNRRVADWSEVAAEDGQAAQACAADIASAVARAWYDAVADAVRGGLAAFPERHAQVDALAGQHVHVLDESHVVCAGIACGVNDAGQLLVRTSQGPMPVSVGEVSVRPLERGQV